MASNNERFKKLIWFTFIREKYGVSIISKYHRYTDSLDPTLTPHHFHTVLLYFLSVCTQLHNTADTAAPVSNTLFWQEAIDQDVGRALIGGFLHAGVSRLSLWGLHLVPSVGSIELNQFLLRCGCRCGRLRALMATLCQPPRGCTKKRQALMSDKCVNIVKALDHRGWCC